MAATPPDAETSLAQLAAELQNVQGGLQQLRAAPPPPDSGEPEQRRKPGRPSKVPPAPARPHEGLVGKPEVDGRDVELELDRPFAFRDVFAFLDRMKPANIVLHFEKEIGLHVYSQYQGDKILCSNFFDGSTAVRFFASQDFWLQLTHRSVKKLFSCIDKTCTGVTIHYSRSDYVTLNFEVHDSTLGKVNRFPITVGEHCPHSDNEGVWAQFETDGYEAARDDYQLSWTVTKETLKKTHEVAKQNASDATIQVTLQAGVLTLQHPGSGVPNFSEIYNDPAKIFLKTSLGDGDFYDVAYGVADGMLISSSVPAGLITVYCGRPGERILFRCEHMGVRYLVALKPFTSFAQMML